MTEATLATTTTTSAALNLNVLPPGVRRSVRHLEKELMTRVEQFGKSGLRIGHILTQISERLAPLGMFNAYLARLSWMPRATAFRWMAAYKRAQEALPYPIMERVLASGLPMYGASDEAPYGRFTKAVEAVGKPTEQTNPDEWLDKVYQKYRQLTLGSRGVPKTSAEDVLTSATRGLFRSYRRVKQYFSPSAYMDELTTRFMAAITLAQSEAQAKQNLTLPSPPKAIKTRPKPSLKRMAG